MKHHTKVHPTKGPPPRVRSTGRRPTGERSRPWWLPAMGVLAILAVAVPAVFVAVSRDGGSGSATSTGLPDTPDYHSLLVAPTNPDALVLGTHNGLYRSADGGRTWRKAELEGSDAMNLAQPTAGTVWAAGHSVLAKSTDGGATWQDVRPEGLPSLDVHGFAADPSTPGRLYAAIAGEGLFRSDDNGATFRLVSESVGPAVMAMVVLPDGTLLAGDMGQRVLAASADGGATWRGLVEAPVMGLAVDPSNPLQILASGPGVLMSTDGGKTWKQTLDLQDGSGPIAFSQSDPTRVYVVGFDRTLYTSSDRGASWRPATSREEG